MAKNPNPKANKWASARTKAAALPVRRATGQAVSQSSVNISGAARFRTLADILEKHGYVLFKIDGSHRSFVHADRRKPMVLLPVRDKFITEAHVQAVRRVLDESGVINARAFDTELRAAG